MPKQRPSFSLQSVEDLTRQSSRNQFVGTLNAVHERADLGQGPAAEPKADALYKKAIVAAEGRKLGKETSADKQHVGTNVYCSSHLSFFVTA